MALFKIFRGLETELNTVPCHEGYAYFTEEDENGVGGGNLYIDIASTPGSRVQVNARLANALRKTNQDGTITEIDVDDLLLKDAAIAVQNGGTGRNTLTVNAVLLGNGTDQIKMVTVQQGSVLVGGDNDTGLNEARGVGVLYALTEGAPQFGTLPITLGGTGAISAAAARQNLEVYSKQDVDTKVDDATTKAYTTTLTTNGWLSQDGKYVYTYTNDELKCGKDHNVPPTITYTSNLEEYSKIEKAEATNGVGITFTIAEKPASNIGIIIVDTQ